MICTFFGATAFAQKAGSGSDQIASFAEPIDNLPTEGTLFGLPVNIHGQTTYINQRYNNFTSSYSGMNSMSAQKSMAYTWSGTLFFGARVAPNKRDARNDFWIEIDICIWSYASTKKQSA